MSITDRRSRQKAEIRQLILEAARSLARDKDWNAVTIRSIADAIEYTPPIVYEHFQNKEDVLLQIAREGHDYIRQQIDEVMSLPLGAEEKLVRISMVQWQFATEQPEVFRLMHNPERMGQYPEQMESDLRQARFRLQDLFESLGVANAKIPEIVFNWFCLMQGYISLVINIKPEEVACKLKKLEQQEDKHVIEAFRHPEQLYERAIRRFIRCFEGESCSTL